MPGIGLASLLISGDVAVQHVLGPTLEKLAINVEVCDDVDPGKNILRNEKFDAVIVDCDDLQGGTALLQGLRQTASNKNSVAFAIVNGRTTTQQAFEMGANFVLQKPITQLNASRCFNAALGFMERERRRYFRHPVEIAVKILFGEARELKAKSSNISEGGMAIRVVGPFPKEPIAKIQFELPEKKLAIECRAEMAWADGMGCAGLRFLDLAPSYKHQLETWLGDLMEKALTAKADKLAKSR